MKNKTLRIPFQGSKNAIVKKLYKAINDDLGNTDCLFNQNKITKIYDLFCGGGSVGYYFYQNGFEVEMNDINTDLIELHKRLNTLPKIENELLYKWISREEFKEIITQKGWYAEMIRICWSFGNNKKSYLYGNDIEDYKKQLHFTVVNKCEQSARNFLEMLGKLNDYDNFSKIFDIKEQKERKLFIRNYVLKNTVNKPFGKHNDTYLYCNKEDYEIIKDMSMVERAKWLNENKKDVNEDNKLNAINVLRQLKNSLDSLEKLRNLESLQSLERLEILKNHNLKQIKFHNKNYYDFELDDNSIVYCDPPYLNTTGYDKQEFDFERFDNWVREMKNKGIKVYISEYTNHNNEWREVVSINKIALACNKTTSGTKKVKQEKIFCNI